MAKQLNVNLAFNAETAQAKKAIEDLSQSLRKIQVQPSRMFDDSDLKKASQAAQDLEKHLQAAVNVNTGKLDLNKFSQSLSKANQHLGDLYKDLSLAGSEGQAAFLNLARSINAAESSSINLGSKLKELGTTLQNTLRWEFSSKIMHGFESAISSAYGYAQDLNRSLNDIRIVTGASSDEMAKFAESANRAAKRLSTTTTDYTNASLIYFQQGLTEQEVAERTEVTIKMANAAGVSAEKVSDQMTAVWNNFAKAGDNLEYYADVMTALGAATASSTDEISAGLNKFAAVAETVGLSYEYATAALATVTSETRESAEVVGTAYKTLFARIQGLQQGDTMDDGTTLNKYSEALSKVGINIKEANGDMKDMDSILNELGAKWGTLAKDQQLALAQTVAGVRQYTQLIALMDNWETFQVNLDVAYGAEGALDEQAEIYAESWEAASKRVQAAAEGIFQELLNDDFFIDILNGFEGFLTGINNVIDGVGGLKTILLSVGGIFLKQYAKEIPAALSALGNNFDVITGKAEKNRQKMLEENKEKLFAQKTTFMSDAQVKELETMRQVSDMTVKLEKNRKNLSQAEIQAYEYNINMVKAYGESSAALAKESKAIEQKLKSEKKLAAREAMSQKDVTTKLSKANEKVDRLKDELAREQSLDKQNQNLKKQDNLIKKIAQAEKDREKIRANYNNKKSSIKEDIDAYAEMTKQQSELINIQDSLVKTTGKWTNQIKNVDEGSEDMKKYGAELEKYLQSINKFAKVNISSEDFQKLAKDLADAGDEAEKTKEILDNFAKNKFGNSIDELDFDLENLETKLRELNVPDEVIEEIRQMAEAAGHASLEAEELQSRIAQLGADGVNHTMQLSEAFGVMASTMMEVWGAIEAVKNLGSIWSNDDLSTGEKMFQTVSAMLPVIVSLTSVLGKQNLAQLASAASSIVLATGLGTEATASAAAAVATTGFNGSLATLLTLLWPIAAVIGAVVLAVWGIAKAFQAAEAASPEGQMKALKEEAEELESTLENTKQKAEELSSAFDNYDSVVETLKNCTKGTEEWQNALNNVNNTVLEILKNNPELATYVDSEGKSGVYRDEETGALAINQNWMNEQEQLVNDQILAQTAALQNNQIRQHKLDENNALQEAYGQLNYATGKDFSSYDIDKDEYNYDAVKEIAEAYVEGNNEAIKSVLAEQDFNSLVNDLHIRLDNPEFDNLDSNKQREMVVNKLEEYGWAEEGQGEAYLQTRLDNLYSQFEYSLVNSGLDEALRNYAASIDTTTAAQNAYNDSMAQTLLADNKVVRDSKYTDEIIDISGDIYGNLKEDNYKARYDAITDRTGLGAGTQVAKDAMAEYAALMGLDDLKDYEVTNFKADGSVEYSYTDGDETKRKTIDAETIASALAAADANKQLAASAEGLAVTFSSLEKDEVSAISATMSGDSSHLTVDQIDKDYDIEGLASKLDEKTLQDMGYEGGLAEMRNAFIESYNEVASNASNVLEDIINDYTQSVQTSMNTLKKDGALSELTLTEVDSLGNAMQEVFSIGGQAALDNFSGIFESIDTKQRDEFINTLGSIDWQTTSVDSLKKQLEDTGVTVTKDMLPALQSWIDTMQSGAIGIEAATTKYASLHEIIDGLETGDTISEEEFNRFEEYGIAADNYFMRMADGTYKLIGDAEEFYNKVNGESLEGFEQNLADKQADKAAIENVLSHDISSLGEVGSGNNYAMGGHYYTGMGNYVMNGDAANAQLDYLEQTGYDAAQVKEWREEMSSGTLDVKELTQAVNSWTEELGGAEAATEKLKNSQEETNNEIEQSETAILSSAKSLTSLNKKAKENQTSTKSYNKALKGLASQYESCHDEIEDYNKAIEKHGEDSEEAQKAAKELEKALENAEWKELTKGIKGYLDELKKLKDSDEIQKVYKEMAKSINDTFDTSVTADFVSENIDLFKQWRNASGVEAQQLGLQIKNMAIMASTDANTILSNNPIQLDIDGDGALNTVTDVATKWANMKSILESNPIQIDANGNADMTNLISALLAAGYTAEEVAALIAAIGQTEVKVEGWGDGLPLDLETEEGLAAFAEAIANWDGGFQVTGGQVPAVEAMDMSQIGDNSGGGGGGSKPKKAEPTKKSDIVERYKELEDQLDDVREESERVKNSLDRLYGEEQEAAIQRLLELEQQEIALMKQKAEEAEKFMQEDLDELMKVSAEVDVEFKVDEKGNLVNYTEEMTELYEELSALETKAGDEWDEKEQEEISALKEKIAKLEEAIAAYEETRELLEDINSELDEMAGTPPLPLIKSEYLDVYYEVEDKLDDIEEKIKDLEREAEGLTGEARLEVLRQIQELEEERLKTLEEQKEVARQDMEDKKAAMEEIAERNDLDFKYDDNGNITNYISEMEKLNEAYEDLYDQVTEDGLVTDDELAALDAMREDMEQMEEYAQGYRQAMETIEDIENEIEDKGSGKANDRFVRSDHIDIYRETDDQLDDIDEKIDDLERQADKLTGEERIAKLKEIQKLEKQRLEVLKKQKEIAKEDMEDRKAAMEELATLNGLLFEYDENGNITNYEKQMDKLLDKYEEEYSKAMEDGVITETEQAILDAIDQDIQELEEAIDEYRDAVEEMEDIQNEMEEITESGYVDMDQLDEIGDKLHDINNELDDIEEAIDDASKAADRLYGAARIKQMNKTAQLIEKEIDALERKKALQEEIVAEEKAELDEFSKGQVKYDSNGNITNYHEVIDSRKDAIRAEKERLTNDEDGFTETDAEIIQEMIDELERMEEEMEEYEQAQEDLEDIENAIDDAYYEWQDLNAEQLSYKLELTLDVNDRELAKIERQISRLEGNFYTRAEALALMVGGGLGGSSKLGELNSQLSDLQGHYAEIKQWYAEGKISHEAYVSMTKEIQGEIEATAAEMEALQDQMETYYKDTLAAARQELSFYTAQMEHLTGVLGHFKNILTSLGKSQDYEMMDVVLRGQVETLENEVEVAKEAMGMWQQEADEAYAKYQQALASGNQENANMYYLAYQEALNAANEAENKYYQKAQQWAEALKALMQNTLSGLAQDLENALTGGTSFENINNQLKRASSLQEEYLTTTNKIYETTKLMRTAQNEIDKTTNSVAKRKLVNFITETKQMQNQNKLSKYELSIQQAKYDLLLAEIALEEARFAKSTVRLRRDAEGNFGYVYTADAEAVANAEQKFEDAQNKLYNIGLEGANKYTEKYQQTLSEMYDTLTALQNKYLQGGFESEEEYNAAVTEAKEYYYEKLAQYSDLYSVALTTDSRVVADAWSSDFADMTQKTEDWMNAVDGYLVQVREAFAEWERESERIAKETVGTNLTDLKNKVGDIVTESETLSGTITNTVIPAIQSEINEVQRLTDAYAAMSGQIQGAIDKAYALSDALQQDIDASVEQEMAKQDQETEVPGGDSTTPTEPTEDPEPSTEPEPEVPLETPGGDENNGGDQTPPVDPPHTHSYGSWTTDTPATCTSEGKQIRKCSCGESDVKKIPKLNHKASSTWEKNKTHHWHVCTECGTVMDKAEHTLSNGKCSVCNYEPDKKENGVLEVGDTPTYVSGKYFYDSYGTEPAGSRGQGKKVKVTQVIKSPKAGQDYPIHVESNDSAYGWLKASQLQGYDTGGYTGEWGPFGKLALLHEKELILNKADTENFLASLELLDGILSTIDLYAMNSQFNSMMDSPYIPDLGKETLEQMVTIEASFPNATDKQEIEDAFKELVNLASQYANRK